MFLNITVCTGANKENNWNYFQIMKSYPVNKYMHIFHTETHAHTYSIYTNTQNINVVPLVHMMDPTH